ncbi:MAG: hypothetical protein ACI9N9_002248 [Enterobacterales bacterium]|jgi:hypothetical protein
MNKSIESIWEEGFLKGDELIIPKINNLYEQKSIHIIDKFKKMFRINLIAITVSSIIVLIVTIAVKLPFLGIIIFLLLNALVINGIKHMKFLQTIDKTVSSYEYLKSFDNWLKDQISSYTRLYQYFYPLLFLGMVMGVYFSVYWERILSELIIVFPSSSLIMGIPVYFLIPVAIITILLGVFGGAIYRMDLELSYGNIIRKLDGIINDMEELRG